MSEDIRLSNRLRIAVTTYNQSNEDYKIYIHDHKDLILTNSTLTDIDINTMWEYTYRPDLFLKEQCSIDFKYTWIFLFINNLVSDLDFNYLVTQVYIPDIEYIVKLLATFKAVIAYGKKQSS